MQKIQGRILNKTEKCLSAYRQSTASYTIDIYVVVPVSTFENMDRGHGLFWKILAVQG